MATKVSETGNFRTEDNPAPGELRCVHGFLNTWSDELGIEDFETSETTEQWLRSASLWEGTKGMTQKEHRRILEFRSLLRDCVLHPDHAERLNKWISPMTFNVEFQEAGSASLMPSGRGCDKVIGQLISIIFNSMVEGTWTRFKCCALPSCGWAYYDSTRSRTKRWCSMRTCGSRHKAREYYKRKR